MTCRPAFGMSAPAMADNQSRPAKIALISRANRLDLK
jgi:hypothetical protein